MKIYWLLKQVHIQLPFYFKGLKCYLNLPAQVYTHPTLEVWLWVPAQCGSNFSPQTLSKLIGISHSFLLLRHEGEMPKYKSKRKKKKGKVRKWRRKIRWDVAVREFVSDSSTAKTGNKRLKEDWWFQGRKQELVRKEGGRFRAKE
jgi:hypothetical protein